MGQKIVLSKKTIQCNPQTKPIIELMRKLMADNPIIEKHSAGSSVVSTPGVTPTQEDVPNTLVFRIFNFLDLQHETFTLDIVSVTIHSRVVQLRERYIQDINAIYFKHSKMLPISPDREIDNASLLIRELLIRIVTCALSEGLEIGGQSEVYLNILEQFGENLCKDFLVEEKGFLRKSMERNSFVSDIIQRYSLWLEELQNVIKIRAIMRENRDITTTLLTQIAQIRYITQAQLITILADIENRELTKTMLECDWQNFVLNDLFEKFYSPKRKSMLSLSGVFKKPSAQKEKSIKKREAVNKLKELLDYLSSIIEILKELETQIEFGSWIIIFSGAINFQNFSLLIKDFAEAAEEILNFQPEIVSDLSYAILQTASYDKSFKQTSFLKKLTIQLSSLGQSGDDMLKKEFIDSLIRLHKLGLTTEGKYQLINFPSDKKYVISEDKKISHSDSILPSEKRKKRAISPSASESSFAEKIDSTFESFNTKDRNLKLESKTKPPKTPIRKYAEQTENRTPLIASSIESPIKELSSQKKFKGESELHHAVSESNLHVSKALGDGLPDQHIKRPESAISSRHMTEPSIKKSSGLDLSKREISLSHSVSESSFAERVDSTVETPNTKDNEMKPESKTELPKTPIRRHAEQTEKTTPLVASLIESPTKELLSPKKFKEKPELHHTVSESNLHIIKTLESGLSDAESSTAPSLISSILSSQPPQTALKSNQGSSKEQDEATRASMIMNDIIHEIVARVMTRQVTLIIKAILSNEKCREVIYYAVATDKFLNSSVNQNIIISEIIRVVLSINQNIFPVNFANILSSFEKNFLSIPYDCVKKFQKFDIVMHEKIPTILSLEDAKKIFEFFIENDILDSERYLKIYEFRKLFLKTAKKDKLLKRMIITEEDYEINSYDFEKLPINKTAKIKREIMASFLAYLRYTEEKDPHIFLSLAKEIAKILTEAVTQQTEKKSEIQSHIYAIEKQSQKITLKMIELLALLFKATNGFIYLLQIKILEMLTSGEYERNTVHSDEKITLFMNKIINCLKESNYILIHMLYFVRMAKQDIITRLTDDFLRLASEFVSLTHNEKSFEGPNYFCIDIGQRERELLHKIGVAPKEIMNLMVQENTQQINETIMKLFMGTMSSGEILNKKMDLLKEMMEMHCDLIQFICGDMCKMAKIHGIDDRFIVDFYHETPNLHKTIAELIAAYIEKSYSAREAINSSLSSSFSRSLSFVSNAFSYFFPESSPTDTSDTSPPQILFESIPNYTF